MAPPRGHFRRAFRAPQCLRPAGIAHDCGKGQQDHGDCRTTAFAGGSKQMRIGGPRHQHDNDGCAHERRARDEQQDGSDHFDGSDEQPSEPPPFPHEPVGRQCAPNDRRRACPRPAMGLGTPVDLTKGLREHQCHKQSSEAGDCHLSRPAKSELPDVAREQVANQEVEGAPRDVDDRG